MAMPTSVYSSKDKCSTSTRGSALGGFVRSEMRLIVAFQAGAAAALIFMIVLFGPLTYFWPSPDGNDGVWKGVSTSSLLVRRGQFSQGRDATQGSNAVVYVREWEMPEVREVQASDVVSETVYGEVPRRFVPFGTGNFLFSLFAAYRTGPQTFVVLGLGPRLMHKYWSKPGFECYWESNKDTSSSSSQMIHQSKTRLPHGNNVIQGTAKNHYPQDLDLETIAEYTSVVVSCTFESPVGLDGNGGELKMIADHGEAKRQTPVGPLSVEFVALTEERGAYNATSSEAPFLYEYMYCGASLYGSVNPHRLREWLAYHMRLFGENSHFVFYDNGGVGDEAWTVLEPWVKAGRLTVMNVRQESRYFTYLYSQFLLANDCLYRAKPLARWAFFFDVDEYLYVTASPHLELSFHKVMSEMAEKGRKATSIQFHQRSMSHALCVRNDYASSVLESQWAIEKLVYKREVKAEEHYEFSRVWKPSIDDFKSAVQPNYVVVMGVHEPADVELPEGFTTKYEVCAQPNMHVEDERCSSNSTGDKLVYYHFHGMTSLNEEACKEFVDPKLMDEAVEHEGAPYMFDNSLNLLVDRVKEYELKAISKN